VSSGIAVFEKSWYLVLGNNNWIIVAFLPHSMVRERKDYKSAKNKETNMKLKKLLHNKRNGLEIEETTHRVGKNLSQLSS
jgi:hypothetical protein